MVNDEKGAVTIYGAEWCPPCHMLKQYLDSKKVAYKYINIDEEPAAGREISAKTGWMAIPITAIGDEHILGFDRAKIDSALRANQLI